MTDSSIADRSAPAGFRIGLVCPYDLSTPGGVQEQVIGLARALARLGHSATVVAPGTADGVTRMGRSFRFPVNGSTAAMAPHPAAAVRTVRTLRRGGFDVIHLHEPLAPSITIPALVAHPAPTVGTFHAAGARTPYRWIGGPLRLLADRIDVRVAVSTSAFELARRHLGGTYEVLFNGLELDRFRDQPPAPANGPTVLFLGRHEPRKGLAVLLEASRHLPSEVTLWIAGSGPDTERLRRLHRPDERIKWLGMLSDAEKIRRLRGASVVCAPSLFGESFGIVLLEAMAAGTPVVASDLPGYRQLSDHGAAAHLTPPGDARAVGTALRRVLFDRCLADSLRVHGLRHARKYSMDELARRYLVIYQRLLATRRN